MHNMGRSLFEFICFFLFFLNFVIETLQGNPLVFLRRTLIVLNDSYLYVRWLDSTSYYIKVSN